MVKPCAAPTCPALARPGRPYCVAHVSSKRLLSVYTGRTCCKCDRVLHAGDYVTIDSTPDRLTHALCPKDEPRKPPRRVGSTPLFDNPGVADDKD